MKEFINKKFKKSKCVKVIYFTEDKKQHTHYLIPKGQEITIKDKSFLINKDDFFLDPKGFITYVFTYIRLEPINPHDVKNYGETTPTDLSIALNSRVASEILSATKNKADINTLLIAMMFLIIIGFGVLWYLLSGDMQTIIERINQLDGVIIG